MEKEKQTKIMASQCILKIYGVTPCKDENGTHVYIQMLHSILVKQKIITFNDHLFCKKSVI